MLSTQSNLAGVSCIQHKRDVQISFLQRAASVCLVDMDDCLKVSRSRLSHAASMTWLLYFFGDVKSIATPVSRAEFGLRLRRIDHILLWDIIGPHIKVHVIMCKNRAHFRHHNLCCLQLMFGI